MSQWLIAIFFVAVGIGHFVNPVFFLKIMPPYLPFHLALVYISGFFEIIGGLGVLIPKLRRVIGWGLIALLIAVFPANVHMATVPELYPQYPYVLLLLRLPMQFVLIAWVYWATIRTTNSTAE